MLEKLKKAVYKSDVSNVRKLISTENWTNLEEKDYKDLVRLTAESRDGTGTYGLFSGRIDKSKNQLTVKLMINFLKKISENDSHLNLLAAVLEGNIKLVEEYLKSGVELKNLQQSDDDDDAFPALYSAVFANVKTRKDMLSLLIKHGLNMKIKNSDDENLLLYFISEHVLHDDEDAVKIAKILIDSGVLIDEISINNFSALCMSCWRGNFELCLFLIDKGNEVNFVVNEECDTRLMCPLAMALDNNDKKLIDLLLSNGANVNVKVYDDDSILHSFMDCFMPDVISFLLRKGADANIKNHQSQTLFGHMESYLGSEDRESYFGVFKIPLKHLAIQKFYGKTVLEEDMNLMRSNPQALKIFEKCSNELSKMSSTTFYPPFTYLSVLKMATNIKKLAKLTKNDGFVDAFKIKVSTFKYYKKDLREIFDEAEQKRNELDELQRRLKITFGNSLPDIALAILADNLRYINHLPLK